MLILIVAIIAAVGTGEVGASDETQLEGFWPLDAGTGAVAVDNSTNQNSGTITGATWTQGRFGSGLAFAGGGGVTISDNAILEVVVLHFSVGLWFKTPTNATQVLVSKWDPTEHGYQLRLVQNGTVEFAIGDGGNVTRHSHPVSYHDDKWHHVLMVRDYQYRILLYFDGSIVANVTDGTGGVKDTDEDLCYGRPSWSTSEQGFVGSVDELVLFHRKLSPFEVAHLFSDSLAVGKPAWLPIPTQHAVEDVPCTVDFRFWFIDLDTPKDKLIIASYSDFVIEIDKHYITFLFPNGFTRVNIELLLFDAGEQVDNSIDFRIQPVNDPPEHCIPEDHTATEDILYILILSLYVWDVDNETTDLTVIEDDPFVQTDGLRVDVRFPNGVLEYGLHLTLTDGLNGTDFELRFTIRPVNDPPEHNLATEHHAVEDIPMVFSLLRDIWDVDNTVVELEITTDSVYLLRNVTCIWFTFPDGIIEHDCVLYVSDGEFEIAIPLHFIIQPVDDTPTIKPLSMHWVREEEMSEVDLRSIIHDIDTEWEDLMILSDNPNASVHGDILRLLFPIGGVMIEVNVQVCDENNPSVNGTLMVYIEAVNDPPEFLELPLLAILEDEVHHLDLDPLIADEETPNELLGLICDHPNVIDIEGMVITLLFTEGPGTHSIAVTVFDGHLSSHGNISVDVLEVNDWPRILGTKPLLADHTVTLNEGDEVDLRIVTEDEDDDTLYYSVIPNWTGVEIMPNGTLQIRPKRGDVGTFELTVRVMDASGAEASINITINVLNINDPPDLLEIKSPLDGAVFDEGEEIRFNLELHDPDIALGQELTIEWMSSRNGILWNGNTTTGASFSTTSLEAGRHTISVTVFDGEHQRKISIEITVESKDQGSFPNMYVVTAVVIALMIAILAIIWGRHVD